MPDTNHDVPRAVYPSLSLEMDPEAMSDCRAGAATALSCCREWGSAHQGSEHLGQLCRAEGSDSLGHGADSSQSSSGQGSTAGRAQCWRHNISYPPWCLAEDGHLNHILVPRGRRINHGRGKEVVLLYPQCLEQ